MATTKAAIMRVYNGTDFDTYHLETSGGQVKLTGGVTAQQHADDAVKHPAFTNKAVLDTITQSMINAWNGKSTSKVVTTIAARNALTGMAAGDIAYVTDATGDSTVDDGGATYIYSGSAWVKIAEWESMDVVLAWANITGKPASTTANIDDAVSKKHTHTNQAQLDGITAALIGNWNTAYTHSQAAHAPAAAQKNSDITKAEIEAKLVGSITSHTHPGAAITVSATQPATAANGDVWLQTE